MNRYEAESFKPNDAVVKIKTIDGVKNNRNSLQYFMNSM